MGTGFGGTYVLATSQTTLDGIPATTGQLPRLGQIWAWQGDAVRMDGPQSTLLLGESLTHNDLHARAAKVVCRRFDVQPAPPPRTPVFDEIPEGFELNDGVNRYVMIPIFMPRSGEALLWCVNGVPKPGTNYTVIRTAAPTTQPKPTPEQQGDVICFTAGTRIRTPDGYTRVEDLLAGDKVQTKDNGPQELLWVGSRHLTGARLHASPSLRPVRIRAHALAQGVPNDDLLVSPHHRMLYQGPKARVLFNEPEVLVRACDMIDDHDVFTDYALREVTYVHLLFAEHQIVWANRMLSESFHPANTTLDMIDPGQRDGLLELFPHLAHDLHSYGAPARRNLDKPEAAILLHDL